MGSTIYERLGPKPAKYSMGQALGDAIKGGGAYFGAVAVEKAKAEALQQARAAKLEDRAYEDARYDEREATKTTAAAAVRDEAREYEDTKAIEEVNKTIQVRGSDLDKFGFAFGADEGINPSMVYDVDVNKQGDPVEGFRESTDYAILQDGTIGRLSAGKTGVSNAKPNEQQIKTFGMSGNGRTAAAGLAKLYGIDIATGDLTSNYSVNPEKSLKGAALGALGDSGIATAIKPEMTNILETFQNQMLIPVRQFISGAAFTKDETPVYLKAYVPLPGDPAEIKALKLVQYDVLMGIIGNSDLQTTEGQARARALAEEARFVTLGKIGEMMLELNPSNEGATTFTPEQQARLDEYSGGR